MSLQAKFAILLALFALVVALSLGVALTFGELLQRELVVPFDSATGVMGDLGGIKRRIEDQIRLIPAPAQERLDATAGAIPRPAPASHDPAPTADLRRGLDAASNGVAATLDGLARNPWFTERVGVSTSRALRETIERARAAAESWLLEPDPARAGHARAALFEVHELIERIEQRILRDTAADLSYGESLRALHRRIIFGGIAAAAVIALLGMLLVRRWVTRPVGLLRAAADEIAKGRFSHRIPVASADELGLLSAEVNRMAGTIGTMQAEAIERERLAATGEMVRRLAHNLRNPLAGIRGLAELSRKRAPYDERLRADQQEIILAVDRFNVWLTELLDATSPMKVTIGDLEPRPWLRDILDAHQPLARMRAVKLRGDVNRAPERVRADRRHLEHAVVAILTNAIQASDADRPVTLTAAVASENPGEWLIEITDQGPGIPAENLEKIFRPYFTTKRDGNGIGLAVAQQVVRQHSGRIEVESVVEKGTTFRIRLPIGGMIDSGQAENSRAAGISREGEASGDGAGD